MWLQVCSTPICPSSSFIEQEIKHSFELVISTSKVGFFFSCACVKMSTFIFLCNYKSITSNILPQNSSPSYASPQFCLLRWFRSWVCDSWFVFCSLNFTKSVHKHTHAHPLNESLLVRFESQFALSEEKSDGNTSMGQEIIPNICTQTTTDSFRIPFYLEAPFRTYLSEQNIRCAPDSAIPTPFVALTRNSRLHRPAEVCETNKFPFYRTSQKQPLSLQLFFVECTIMYRARIIVFVVFVVVVAVVCYRTLHVPQKPCDLRLLWQVYQ